MVRCQAARSFGLNWAFGFRQTEGEDELKKRQLMELAIINGTYRDSSAKGAGEQAFPTGTHVPFCQFLAFIMLSVLGLLALCMALNVSLSEPTKLSEKEYTRPLAFAFLACFRMCCRSTLDECALCWL